MDYNGIANFNNIPNMFLTPLTLGAQSVFYELPIKVIISSKELNKNRDEADISFSYPSGRN